MTARNEDPTDVEKNPQNLYHATGDASSSDSSTFVQKLEHLPVGYADDRNSSNAADIKAEVADSYVHQHVSAKNNK